VIPLLGAGPFWVKYDAIMDPCKTYWWTVLTFTNNIIPTESYDAKCFPFAWFVPCLVQLSLVTPLILAIYTKFSYQTDPDIPKEGKQNLVRVFFSIIFCICLGSCALATGTSTKGPLPIYIAPSTIPNAKINSLNTLNLDFYNSVYMLPYF